MFLWVTFCHGAVPEETCHTFGAGTVYPLGVDPKKAEHKLQWTQAVSKLLQSVFI